MLPIKTFSGNSNADSKDGAYGFLIASILFGLESWIVMLMNKQSFLFLIIIAATAAMGVYEAFQPLQAGMAFTRFLGLEAFMLLCVSLIIGPLAILDQKYIPLIEPRRSIGLAAFSIMAGHVILAVIAEYDWDIGSLLTYAPTLVSIPAAILMLVLALTSSDYAIKLLGAKAWKWVQSANYLIFAFSFAHFLMSATGLFATRNTAALANYSEVAMVALGIAVVIIQAWGFMAKRKRLMH